MTVTILPPEPKHYCELPRAYYGNLLDNTLAVCNKCRREWYVDHAWVSGEYIGYWKPVRWYHFKLNSRLDRAALANKIPRRI